MTTRRGYLTSFGSFGAISVLSVLQSTAYLLLAANVASLSDFGAFSVATAVIAILRFFLCLGIDRSILIESSSVQDASLRVRRPLPLLSSLWIGSALAWATLGVLSESGLVTTLSYGISLALSAAATLMSAFLRIAGKDIQAVLGSGVLAPFGSSIALIVLWATGAEIAESALALSMLLGSAFAFGLSIIWTVRARPKGVDVGRGPSGKLIARRSAPFLVMSGAQLISSRADLLVLGALRGAEAAGVYAVASRLALALAIPATTVGLWLTPRLTLLRGERWHETAGLLRLARALSVGLTFVPSLAAVALARPLLSLFDTDLEVGGDVLRVLVLAQLVASISAPITIAVLTSGARRIAIAIEIASAILLLLSTAVAALSGSLVIVAMASGVQMVVRGASFELVWRWQTAQRSEQRTTSTLTWDRPAAKWRSRWRA